ncbi:hypothetical protein LOZ80_12115 [Paenibacillus sp. HWE-109]|uniref:hypothetical protein n=1 Tax=Paenibacillus sp. HWE-109 TaxID=1306526 RepID=UPI001EDCF535|nr:hypothetical protein [Paenibacillus sp. HWE-109]UKS29630.1 hypothetical protein LOZ80_12115 [Paenibacillus sp. HWE-109]
MEEKDQFLGYLGDYRVHDSKIEGIFWENTILIVTLRSCEGEVVVVKFYGVQTINSNRPIGMMLYSVSEMKENEPFRKFLFVNWDEEDNASFEIVAEQIEFIV